MQSLFADAGNERQILLEVQKSITTMATQLEIPLDLPESGDEVDSEPFSDGEVSLTSGSESD